MKAQLTGLKKELNNRPLGGQEPGQPAQCHHNGADGDEGLGLVGRQ